MHQKAILAGAGVLVVAFLTWLWTTEGAAPGLARVQAAAPRADRTPAGGPGSDLASSAPTPAAATPIGEGEESDVAPRPRRARKVTQVTGSHELDRGRCGF